MGKPRQRHRNAKSDTNSVKLFNNLASLDPQNPVGLGSGWKLIRCRDDDLTSRNVFKEGSGAAVIKFREHIVEHKYRR
jgi:hypothetical protein